MAVAVCPLRGVARSRVHRSRPRANEEHVIDVEHDVHRAINDHVYDDVNDDAHGSDDDHLYGSASDNDNHADAVDGLRPFGAERAVPRLWIRNGAGLSCDYDNNNDDDAHTFDADIERRFVDDDVAAEQRGATERRWSLHRSRDR